MQFESKHSLNENEFRLFHSPERGFPLHLHRSFELYAQTSGTAEVTIDEKTYVIGPGDAVLIFPFQLHSYKVDSDNFRTLCIFSPDLVPDFYASREQSVPCSNLFTLQLGTPIPTDNLFLKRSFAYRICGEFDRGRTYTAKNSSMDPTALTELLLYAEKNFRSSCLLRDAAAAIGYDYGYISKYFKRQTGIAFRQYVNRLRIQESQKLLTQSSFTMSQIADACGFSCLRTFDREFLFATGLTPTEFRKKRGDLTDKFSTNLIL